MPAAAVKPVKVKLHNSEDSISLEADDGVLEVVWSCGARFRWAALDRQAKRIRWAWAFELLATLFVVGAFSAIVVFTHG